VESEIPVHFSFRDAKIQLPEELQAGIDGGGIEQLGGAIVAQGVYLTRSSVTGSTVESVGDNGLARGGGIYATSVSCAYSTISGNAAKSYDAPSHQVRKRPPLR
jgi:hypothetical protein